MGTGRKAGRRERGRSEDRGQRLSVCAPAHFYLVRVPCLCILAVNEEKRCLNVSHHTSTFSSYLQSVVQNYMTRESGPWFGAFTGPYPLSGGHCMGRSDVAAEKWGPTPASEPLREMTLAAEGLLAFLLLTTGFVEELQRLGQEAVSKGSVRDFSSSREFGTVKSGWH